MNVFLNLTNGSHLPKGMITHNCQFRKFCTGIDKGQLGYQVFCMTAVYLNLTECHFNGLICMAKRECMLSRTVCTKVRGALVNMPLFLYTFKKKTTQMLIIELWGIYRCINGLESEQKATEC